jgi:hypothetical protein
MNHEVRKARGILEGTAPQIRELLLQRRRVLQETRNDPRFSEEYRRERIAEQEAEYARRLAEVRAEAEGARTAMLEAARKPAVEPGPVMEQVLTELREQRAWSRYSWMMAMGTEPTEAVRRAADSGDADGLRALGIELPAYLQAEGWTPQHVEAVLAQIRTAEEPYLSPEQRAARELEEECEEGWTRLEVAFAHAQGDLDGWSAQATELPVFDGGLLPVSGEAA